MVGNVIYTPTWRHRSFIGIDSSAKQLFTLLLHYLPPLPFISPSLPIPFTSSSSSSSVLLLIIGIHLHRHRYSSLSSSLLSSVFLICPFPSLPPFVHPPPHPKQHFACQMPSKRAKWLPKISFFMRYSEICLIGECLICGAYQQRNKERKVGTFQIMPWCEGCLISGCALVKLDCNILE